MGRLDQRRASRRRRCDRVEVSDPKQGKVASLSGTTSLDAFKRHNQEAADRQRQLADEERARQEAETKETAKRALDEVLKDLVHKVAVCVDQDGKPSEDKAILQRLDDAYKLRQQL